MQALERVLAVVEAVSKNPAGTTPARVADETGLSLSTVVRLMQSLHDEEVLLRRADSYQLGPRLIAIVGRATNAFEVRSAAAPILVQLRDTCGGESASVHVREDHQRMCVAAAYTTHSSGRIVPIGLRLPVTGSAVGHVLLSQLEPRALDEFIAALGLAKAAESQLRDRVARVHSAGYDESADESVEGVRGIAVPVGGLRGNGALSVSGPSDRLTADRVPQTVERLRHAAELLEQTGIQLSALEPAEIAR